MEYQQNSFDDEHPQYTLMKYNVIDCYKYQSRRGYLKFSTDHNTDDDIYKIDKAYTVVQSRPK